MRAEDLTSAAGRRARACFSSFSRRASSSSRRAFSSALRRSSSSFLTLRASSSSWTWRPKSQFDASSACECSERWGPTDLLLLSLVLDQLLLLLEDLKSLLVGRAVSQDVELGFGELKRRC